MAWRPRARMERNLDGDFLLIVDRVITKLTRHDFELFAQQVLNVVQSIAYEEGKPSARTPRGGTSG